MNKVMLMGRLTKDPEVRYSQSKKGDQMAIGKFSLAVDRRITREGEPTADFFECAAFGKLGEFIEKYLKKGTKVVLVGKLQNNNYINKNGEKVYSNQIVIDEIEFAESKKAASEQESKKAYSDQTEEFMQIPEGMGNTLPFK